MHIITKLRVQAVSNPVPAPQTEPAQVVTLDSDFNDEIEHWMHLPIQVPTEVIDSDDSDGEDTSTNEMSKKIRTVDPMTLDETQAANEVEVSDTV